MGVFGRKNTAQTEELKSDQATREISASQLAEVLARVDGDRQSDSFERAEGRISGTRQISDPRPSDQQISATDPVSAAMLAGPREEQLLDSTPQLAVVESTANARVVTAHQNTRAMTIALVLAMATFFAAVVLAYRY